jgi:DNA-binding response OmpR family regulator
MLKSYFTTFVSQSLLMGKILILDNDSGNLDVLSLVCIDEGYEVRRLGSADGLSEMITSFKPELVFVDILLGNENGIEICHSLRKESATAGIKVILMSACQLNMKKAKTSQCADAYLAKPFDIDDVAALARELLK